MLLQRVWLRATLLTSTGDRPIQVAANILLQHHLKKAGVRAHASFCVSLRESLTRCLRLIPA